MRRRRCVGLGFRPERCCLSCHQLMYQVTVVPPCPHHIIFLYASGDCEWTLRWIRTKCSAELQVDGCAMMHDARGCMMCGGWWMDGSKAEQRAERKVKEVGLADYRNRKHS
jgi:hypothetical protein